MRFLLAAVILLLAACASDPPDTAGPTIVTRPPGDGPDGQLLESDPLTAPDNFRAWRVVYRSSAANGDAIAVTGMVVVPAGDTPEGGWPVVSWGHPTTGTADACTPSWAGPSEIAMVDDLVAAGWAVVATDYEGLGTDSGHPYLVGPSGGASMLDIVSAASTLEGTGIDPTRVALLGFSQGGHAALWAAQLAPTRTPELGILGVAVAAPVSDVTQFVRRAENLPEQFGVLVTVAYGYQQAYPELDLTDILTSDGMERLNLLEEVCIGEVVAGYTDEIDGLLLATPRSVPGWQERLEEGLAGTEPLDVPILVVQGADDPIVFRSVTDELIERLCEQGDLVEYRVLPGVDHGALRTEDMVGFLDAIDDDPALRSSCP